MKIDKMKVQRVLEEHRALFLSIKKANRNFELHISGKPRRNDFEIHGEGLTEDDVKKAAWSLYVIRLLMKYQKASIRKLRKWNQADLDTIKKLSVRK